MSDPHITDDDHGVITATVCGKEVRAWSYANDDERRLKMRMAHEYAEGWFQASCQCRAWIISNPEHY